MSASSSAQLPSKTRTVGRLGTLSLGLFWLNPLGLILAIITFALIPSARKERSTVARGDRKAFDQTLRRSTYFATASTVLQILTLVGAFTFKYMRRPR